MSEQIDNVPPDEHELQSVISLLKDAFPLLDSVPLHEGIIRSPGIKKLGKLIQLSVPIDAYPEELITLYEKITSCYYSHLFRIREDKHQKSMDCEVREEQVSDDVHQLGEISETSDDKPKKVKAKINYRELSTFIKNFGADQEVGVSHELIQMGRVFGSWKVKEINGPELPKLNFQKQQSKQRQNDIKMKKASQKEEKKDLIKIMLGKNFSLEYKQMRDEILDRAKNNKLLEQNTRLTQLEKIANEINYILNRITEEYFNEFVEELKPYAQDEIYSMILSDKIIAKVTEEHNFINIYSKLAKKLKRVKVLIGGDKQLRFKNIFVERLQENFYFLVREGEWEGKEQQYKKQLLGMNQFIGELINSQFLSKYIFSDCFYELIRNYIMEYYKYKDNKSIIYYETYVECVIRIIEKMGSIYDKILLKKNTEDVEEVLKMLFECCDKPENNFQYICDYIEILKLLNQKLPSNRSKITFLLEDFRCSKHLQKEKENLNNKELQIIQDLLSMDMIKKDEKSKIQKKIEGCNKEILMKDYLFQFAEGTRKEVNKNIELFKILSQCKGICDSVVSAFKANIEGLFLIQSDFPFMCEGLARIMKIVCDTKRMNYQELNLGEAQEEDEDIRWFLQSIEGKYYKMIMQD